MMKEGLCLHLFQNILGGRPKAVGGRQPPGDMGRSAAFAMRHRRLPAEAVVRGGGNR